VTGVQADSAGLDDLDRLFETVRRERGAVDVLWASAGVGEQDRTIAARYPLTAVAAAMELSESSGRTALGKIILVP
jgi:NAD(P)-dependent dehydrogenase (short-subunit alcohol dehydrogenase family)